MHMLESWQFWTYKDLASKIIVKIQNYNVLDIMEKINVLMTIDPLRVAKMCHKRNPNP